MNKMTRKIIPILRKASEAIMAIYENESRFQTTYKEDASPLTEADTQSNEIIRQGLMSLYPGIPIISEETKQEGYDQRAGYKEYFLVDPLDGTKEFIKRNGEFTINIAFMSGNSAKGGFVYVPAKGEAYVAEKNSGAFFIDIDDQMTELRTKPFYLQDNGLKVVASRSHRDEKTDLIISKLNQPEIVSTGSSLKFLLIASGKADFYPRLAPTMEWDTAAAQCVLEEAGGSVIRYDDLLPLIYNKENLLNPFFIAMGAVLDPESLWDIL